MNKDEYGNILRVNVLEDILSSTNELRLVSPRSVEKTKTSAEGLTVGTVDFIDNSTTPPTTFLANEYVEYKTIITDIDESGLWGMRVFSQSAGATICKITNPCTFSVDP